MFETPPSLNPEYASEVDDSKLSMSHMTYIYLHVPPLLHVCLRTVPKPWHHAYPCFTSGVMMVDACFTAKALYH